MARVTFKKGAKIERWERNLDNPEAALKQIGALMVAESMAAFREQRFGKVAWKERGTPNVFGIIKDFHEGREPPQRRFESRPALMDTGRLARSIAFVVLSRDTVEVGSPLAYAVKHHRGGEVESEKITEKVQKALGEWLKDQGGDLRKRLGFLLNAKFRDQTLKMEVPARPIVGVTRSTIRDAKEAIGVRIFEVQ